MRFEVKAVKGSASVAVLPIDAADTAGAAEEARRRGYTVLSVRGTRAAGGWRPRAPFPLLLFAQELQSLLAAGLSLTEALESLAENDSAGSGAVIRRLVQGLRAGQSLSQALAAEREAFPEFFVATVRASERTGALAESLKRFAAYQATVDAVRKKVISASIYPVMLVGAGCLVLVFLLAYVVPRFASVLSESGVEMSFTTQLLIGWGALVERHGAAMLAALLATAGGGTWFFSQPAARAGAARLLWRWDAVGGRLRVFQLSRFYRTLGMLVQGGLPVVQALALSQTVLPAILRPAMDAARRDVSEGRASSSALERHGLATPVALRMLRVAERGGNLGEMLERIADFLDEETARWIDWFTRLFEPVLMAAIGLLIGTIVVLMYMPVFELAGAIR